MMCVTTEEFSLDSSQTIDMDISAGSVDQSQESILDTSCNMSCDDSIAKLPSFSYSSTDEFESIEDIKSMSSMDHLTEDESNVLVKDLNEWYIRHDKLSQAAYTDLLHIFRKHNLADLPLDCRTLLPKCRPDEISTIGGGQYYHFGLKNGIMQKLDLNKKLMKEDGIHVNLSVDGLPLAKNSTYHFWPILCLIKSDKEPFVVGLYAGHSKPKDISEFVDPLIEELKDLDTNRLPKYDCPIIVDAVICDAPARSFVKNVKQFSGYYGCDKCVQEGEYIANKVAFTETDADLRNDDDYESYEDHHQGKNPFLGTSLENKMISAFPLDYMHLICLGAVKKLVRLWIRGPKPVRQQSTVLSKVSDIMFDFNQYIPSDFNRKHRPLTQVDRWKATECRTFLLYTGPVALKLLDGRDDDLEFPEALRQNFMLLSVSMTILLSPVWVTKHLPQAKELMRMFVDHYLKIFGKEEMVYNIHSCLHLPEEAELHGELDNISAFPFENFMGTLKKLIRKPELPLQQAIRRLHERTVILSQQDVQKRILAANHSVCHTEVRSDIQLPSQFRNVHFFKKVTTPVGVLTTENGNNCIMTRRGKIVFIKNILTCESGVFVRGLNCNKENFYTYPHPSSNLDIYKATLCQQFIYVRSDSISKKMFALPTEQSEFAVFPILHSSQHQPDDN